MLAPRYLAIASLLLLLAGCTHDKSYRGGVDRDEGTSWGIPRGARVVDETKGGRLDYVVRERGRVYLADDSARVVIWDGNVREGDRIFVNPDKNRIELNGHEQARIDLKSNHRFVLFFERR